MSLDFPLLGQLALFSFLVPVVAGLIRLKHLPKDFRLIVFLFFLEAFFSILGYWLGQRAINNLWVGHVSHLVEFGILMFTFSRWVDNELLRIQMKFSIGFYVLFWIVAKFFLERIDQPSVYSSTVARAILAFVAVYMLITIAKQTLVPILENPRFWVVSGVLIITAGGLMFFALRGAIMRLPQQELLLAFSTHWILLIAVNLIFTRSVMCKPHP